MSLSVSLPPSDIEAERALIGSWFLLHDEPAEIRKTRVEPSEFYDPKLASIASAILSCLDDGIPIDPVTVTHRIGSIARDRAHAHDLTATLAECAGAVTSPTHAHHHARLVENAAALRRLANAAQKALAASQEPGADAAAVQADMASAVTEANQAAHAPIQGKASDYIGQAVADILTPRDTTGKDGRLSWGVRELDLAGCFIRPGSFPVVAARPGCGKTTFLRRFAFRTAAMTRRKVIYLTLEQDPVELIYDELLAEGGVKDPCGKGITSDDDAMRLTSAAEFLDSIPLYAPATFPHRLQPLVVWLHRTIATEKPAVVVIDYLTLIQAPGKSTYEQATMTSSRLRSIARQTGCPIVCAAQLNRASAGDRREPELHDLRDSGQIEQDATSVIMLHYPYGQATREDRQAGKHDPGEMFLLVKKNRHGQNFVRVPMLFEGAYKRMLVREVGRS
jgi:replicative DNA helicase